MSKCRAKLLIKTNSKIKTSRKFHNLHCKALLSPYAKSTFEIPSIIVYHFANSFQHGIQSYIGQYLHNNTQSSTYVKSVYY